MSLPSFFLWRLYLLENLSELDVLPTHGPSAYSEKLIERWTEDRKILLNLRMNTLAAQNKEKKAKSIRRVDDQWCQGCRIL